MRKKNQKINVCYILSYKSPDYTRTETLINALRNLEQENKIKLYTCINESNNWQRYFETLFQFLKIKFTKNINVYIVGFRGHEILPLIRLFTFKPIIWDAFLSIYDTLCFERKTFKPNSISGKLIFYYEKFCCFLSNKILLDTKQHCLYFQNTFNIKPDKLKSIYVGANQKIFYPLPKKKNRKFEIFWYGHFHPLQGVEYILKAAKLLERTYPDIHFIIAGKEKNNKYGNYIKKLKHKLNLLNTTFLGFVPHKELPRYIAKADICLGGHFSDINKAKRVIAGKTFQFIAMKKPVILSDNMANREIFTDGINCLFCQPASSNSLAKTIIKAKQSIDLNIIKENGYKIFLTVLNEIEQDLFKIIFNYAK